MNIESRRPTRLFQILTAAWLAAGAAVAARAQSRPFGVVRQTAKLQVAAPFAFVPAGVASPRLEAAPGQLELPISAQLLGQAICFDREEPARDPQTPEPSAPRDALESVALSARLLALPEAQAGWEGAHGVIGNLFGETPAGPTPSAPAGPIPAGVEERRRDLFELLESKGVPGASVRFLTDAPSWLRRAEPNVLEIRAAGRGPGSQSLVAAIHKIVAEAADGLRGGRFSYLTTVVWDIGIEGEAASYRTEIPFPGKPVDPDRFGKIMETLPERVRAYLAMNPAVRPFPCALKTIMIDKGQLQTSLWSLHARPKALPGAGQDYYAMGAGR